MVKGNKEVVNTRIRYYMHLQNITIANLARLANASQHTAYRWVYPDSDNGLMNYQWSTIERLADVFGVTVFDMLTPLDIDASEIKPPDGRIKHGRYKKV